MTRLDFGMVVMIQLRAVAVTVLAAAVLTAYGFSARRQRESELKIAESPAFG